MTRLLGLPELNVAVFAFLLNLVWELGQVPLYRDLPSQEHWAAIVLCGRATLGDAAIAVAAFWAVAVGARSRRWIRAPATAQVIGFLGVGLAITMILEWLATHIQRRWAYAPSMPLVPLLGIGVAPAHVGELSWPTMARK